MSKKNETATEKKIALIDPMNMKGKDLIRFRKERDLSVADLAEQLDITPASIYRWEREKKVLKLHSRSVSAINALIKQKKSRKNKAFSLEEKRSY